VICGAYAICINPPLDISLRLCLKLHKNTNSCCLLAAPDCSTIGSHLVHLLIKPAVSY